MSSASRSSPRMRTSLLLVRVAWRFKRSRAFPQPAKAREERQSDDSSHGFLLPLFRLDERLRERICRPGGHAGTTRVPDEKGLRSVGGSGTPGLACAADEACARHGTRGPEVQVQGGG